MLGIASQLIFTVADLLNDLAQILQKYIQTSCYISNLIRRSYRYLLGKIALFLGKLTHFTCDCAHAS